MVHAPHGKYASTEWIGDGDLGVATWFRSTYQIVGSKFEYDLETG